MKPKNRFLAKNAVILLTIANVAVLIVAKWTVALVASATVARPADDSTFEERYHQCMVRKNLTG